jgi:hypothetical protein
MIEKHTFCDLMYQTKEYWDGVQNLEKSLGAMFDNNFLTKMFDKMLTTLARGFFSTDELNKFVAPCDDYDKTLEFNFETIEDLLYHYACNSDFGREWGLMDETYVIKDKNNNILVSFDGDTPEELYDIIIKFLSRNDDNRHFINCSAIHRGKGKDEINIS